MQCHRKKADRGRRGNSLLAYYWRALPLSETAEALRPHSKSQAAQRTSISRHIHAVWMRGSHNPCRELGFATRPIIQRCRNTKTTPPCLSRTRKGRRWLGYQGIRQSRHNSCRPKCIHQCMSERSSDEVKLRRRGRLENSVLWHGLASLACADRPR